VLEVLYTDFTEIIFRRGQAKAQFMPIIDHKSKVVVGHAVGPSDDTDLALEAWRKAKRTLKSLGQSVRWSFITTKTGCMLGTDGFMRSL